MIAPMRDRVFVFSRTKFELLENTVPFFFDKLLENGRSSECRIFPKILYDRFMYRAARTIDVEEYMSDCSQAGNPTQPVKLPIWNLRKVVNKANFAVGR